jgi:hypothetical protein
MKIERFSAALVAAFIALTAHAGDAHAQDNLLGVKGGLTLASADVEDLEGTFDTDNRTGWAIGAFLTLGSGFLSIQPEVNLLNLGFEPTGLPGAPDVELRYIAPAVLLRLGLPLGPIRPGVLGGVGTGFEIDCKVGDTTCDSSDFGLETSATDLAGVFGADLDIVLGSAVLRAEARYVIGFSDIHEASDIWTEIRNRAWQVQAGIAFGF